MRVALSASYAGCKAAKDLLSTCDMIYTTQVDNYRVLCLTFPGVDIKIIPDCGPAMIEFLKERHLDDEVIGFSELMALREKERKESNA